MVVAKTVVLTAKTSALTAEREAGIAQLQVRIDAVKPVINSMAEFTARISQTKDPSHPTEDERCKAFSFGDMRVDAQIYLLGYRQDDGLFQSLMG